MTTDHQQRIIGAYYFRGGMFTCVPHHVRAELDEMATMGTNVVCLAVTENDLNYNHSNLHFLIKEIHLRSMQVYFVPSRIAGITAGAPLESCAEGYRWPHTVTINPDGKPLVRKIGCVCSFYHEEIEQHFKDVATRMITEFAVDGIIWDEPKSTNWQDFSERAKRDNPNTDFRIYMQDFVRFMSRINHHLKTVKPDLTIVHFDEACRNDIVAEESARIDHMDYYGVDGRPWRSEETGPARNISEQKVLLGYGERYLHAARKEGKKTFALIENQRLGSGTIERFEEHISEVIALDIDMLVYYYYGFYEEDPERNMNVIRQHIARNSSKIGQE